MDDIRHVKLFRNGRNQAVRIPVEFELPGKDAIMRKEGERIVIEPARKREKLSSLLEYLATLQPVEDEFPDVDEGLLPLDDVKL